MGIAAGGKIEQKIYQDTISPLEYDDESVQRVFIHTVTTAAWEVRISSRISSTVVGVAN